MIMELTAESRNEVIVSCVLFVVTSVFLALRFVSSWVSRKPIVLSDIFTGVAWILVLALVVETILWAVLGGNGQHDASLGSHTREEFYKLMYANQITYMVLCADIKLSVNFYYYSIFHSNRALRIASVVLAVIIVAWGICIEFATIFQCDPVAAYWSLGTGKCVDPTKLMYGVQIPNVVFDFFLLLMPWPIIWKTNKSTLDKVGLAGIFALGTFACAAGIARLITLLQVNSADIEYTIYQPTMWTLVEPCISLICISLPFLRSTYHKHQADHFPSLEVKSIDSDSDTISQISSWRRHLGLSLRQSRANRVYVQNEVSVVSTDELSHPEDGRHLGSQLFRPDLPG